jgi:hypothetical protein
MAHFAKIENDVVKNVIVVNNEDCANLDFPQSETVGQAFIASLDLDGVWKQTSYNHNFRKQYASVEYTYNATADVFVKPKPYPSWSLDSNHDWQAPTPRPDTDGMWHWSEDELQWVR